MAQVGEQPCATYGALPVQVAPNLAPNQPSVPLNDSSSNVVAAGPLAAVDMTVHSIFIASGYHPPLYRLLGLSGLTTKVSLQTGCSSSAEAQGNPQHELVCPSSKQLGWLCLSKARDFTASPF